MPTPTLGTLSSLPALTQQQLLAPPVVTALSGFPDAGDIGVVEIPPEFSDTTAMMKHYQLPLTVGANCVLVIGKRDGAERIAACVVRSDQRVDVNNVVKRLLDVRRPSFLPRERATAESGMEYGGITPFGLPETWRVFLDPAVLQISVAVLGSGIRASKLLLAGALLEQLPNAAVVDGLGTYPVNRPDADAPR
jgi:prolyl-tRNA editing enzyme YbaK/EbsC (Cys-tRNA(Pro) deacylase)